MGQVTWFVSSVEWYELSTAVGPLSIILPWRALDAVGPAVLTMRF